MTGAGTALESELELFRASESQRVHAGSERDVPREGAGSGQANDAGDASAPDAGQSNAGVGGQGGGAPGAGGPAMMLTMEDMLEFAQNSFE